MSSVRICVGKKAKTPYRFSDDSPGLYSIEELCFFFIKNVQVLEADMMSTDLIEWIDSELGLRELARNLLSVFRSANSFGLFVITILEYVSYASKEEIAKIKGIISENGRLNTYERRKKRIDYRAYTGDFGGALNDYQVLLANVRGKDLALTASIYYSMGKAAARLFLYDYAEELFEKAYKMAYQRESLIAYLITVKMHGTPEEQRNKVAAFGGLPEAMEEAELLIKDTAEQYLLSEEYEKALQFEEECEIKNNGFYDRVDELSLNLKNEYRKSGDR